ncbi:MAG: hypothetical protein RIR65_1222 [Planctomycetota bacterium]
MRRDLAAACWGAGKACHAACVMNEHTVLDGVGGRPELRPSTRPARSAALFESSFYSSLISLNFRRFIHPPSTCIPPSISARIQPLAWLAVGLRSGWSKPPSCAGFPRLPGPALLGSCVARRTPVAVPSLWTTPRLSTVLHAPRVSRREPWWIVVHNLRAIHGVSTVTTACSTATATSRTLPPKGLALANLHVLHETHRPR